MTDSYTLNSYSDDVEGAVDEIESAHSTLDDAVRSIRSEWDSLRSEIQEARDQLEENEAWAECFDGEDAYDVLEELREWRELGDVDDVRQRIEDSADPDEIDRLRAEVERQAALITRLATALDEIDTITSDELAGTGGE